MNKKQWVNSTIQLFIPLSSGPQSKIHNMCDVKSLNTRQTCPAVPQWGFNHNTWPWFFTKNWSHQHICRNLIIELRTFTKTNKLFFFYPSESHKYPKTQINKRHPSSSPAGGRLWWHNKSRENQMLKGNSGMFKPGPYFCHEIRSSTHREQFGESRRPSEDI